MSVEINRIDHHFNQAWTSNGDCFHYENLISTLPLTELFPRLSSYPVTLDRTLQQLQYMSLKCAMIAIDHPVDTDIQRIYCAEPSIPAHKIAINHNSSNWLRNRSQHGVMGEISYSRFKKFPREDLLDWFCEGLIELGIIKNRNEVFDARLVDVKYAYPVPTHGLKQAVESLKQFLAQNDIYSVGRFGEWAYINSDEAIARGLVLAERILANSSAA